MAGELKDIDRGWKRIFRETNSLADKAVLVGLHGETAERGAYNEYGTAFIPERSFMRSAFDENQSKLSKAAARLYQAVQDDKMTPDQALGLLGEMHQGQIQEKILSNIPPPNAPATVKAKKTSKTLVDTGQMRQSVRWIIESKGVGGFLSRIFGR